jgi:hypothetical protein
MSCGGARCLACPNCTNTTLTPLVPEMEGSVHSMVERVPAALQPLGKNTSTPLEGLRPVVRSLRDRENAAAPSRPAVTARLAHLMNYLRGCVCRVTPLLMNSIQGHLVLAKGSVVSGLRLSIFLAEVASTFNEELLTHYLLEQTDDRKCAPISSIGRSMISAAPLPADDVRRVRKNSRDRGKR